MSDLQETQGLTMIHGQRKIYVNGEEPYIVGKEPWFGKTLFPLTRQAAEDRRMPYAGDLASKSKGKWTLRGRGHIWAAVGVSRTRRARDDLKEGKMSLEDRFTFIHGKKAELTSIFENGVWEIEKHPENIDHSRVMKARFVLKWVTDSAGNPKAKARLVLQGFSDPDLLQGSLETSSPTLSRTSKQTLLAIACNEQWSKFTADVSTAFLQGDKQSRLLWRMQVDGLSSRNTHEAAETAVRTGRCTSCMVPSGEKKALQCWVHSSCPGPLFVSLAQSSRSPGVLDWTTC